MSSHTVVLSVDVHVAKGLRILSDMVIAKGQIVIVCDCYILTYLFCSNPEIFLLQFSYFNREYHSVANFKQSKHKPVLIGCLRKSGSPYHSA